MKRIFQPVLLFGLAILLSFAGKLVSADGFWILGNNLPLAAQTNWFPYPIEAGDSPEGGYMGWLFEGSTNQQAVLDLNRTLPAGTYYLLLKVIDYDWHGQVSATATGIPSPIVNTDDRDWNKYWTTPLVIQATQTFSQLKLNFFKTLPVSEVQKYLFRGLYITTNANENVPLFGIDRVVNYTYPTATNWTDTVKGNLFENSSFEVGLGHGWAFRADGLERDFGLEALWNTNDAYHGAASIHFPKKGELISRICRVRINRSYTLSAWVRSSAPSAVRLSIYNVDTAPPGFSPVQDIHQTFTADATWKRISIAGFLPSYPHGDYQAVIGGDADLWVDALQLEEGELSPFGTHAPVEIGFASAEPGRILYEDENPALDLRAHNNSGQAFSGTVAFEIFDVFNRKISSGEHTLSVPAGSKTVASFPVPVRRGIFRVVAWVKDREGTLEEAVYGVVPRPRISGADESSIIGIHPNLLPFQLAILERLGIKWARAMSPEAIFRWSYMEPLEGLTIFYDEKVDPAAAYGMNILGTISEWPSWADANGLPDLDKWEAFVERLATHYQGKIRFWEIWNEPIYVFTPGFYAELLKRAAAAIHRADPSAKIVGMGGVYDKNWISQVITNLGNNPKQYMDYISTHLYGATTSEPSVGEVEDRMIAFKRDIIDAFGIEVWNTETGFWDEGFSKTANSNFAPSGEAMWPYQDSERFTSGSFYQPERLLDNFLHCAGNGLTKYFYYDSRMVDPTYHRSHPSILESDDTIRSKGIAYAVAAYFVDGWQGLGNVSPNTNSYAYLFDRGSIPTVALCARDKRNHAVQLSGSGWKAFDLMGNEIPLAAATIPFGRSAVYIQCSSLSVNAMRAAFQSASISDVSDGQAPALSIDEFPTGATDLQDISFRWLGIDESSIPSATAPAAVTYSYRLEGRDADWSAWSPGTQAAITSLVPGDYVFKVRARDTSGNICAVESRTLSIIAPANIPPVLASIGNKSINEGSALSFTATATDLDAPAQTLTFSLGAGAPIGASINGTTGAFGWTPSEAQGPGTYAVTIRVIDSGSPSRTDSETINITVNEVNSRPVLQPVADKFVQDGKLLSFNINASDPDLPPQELTFSLGPGFPAGATVNPINGLFSWTPPVGYSPVTNGITVRVSDSAQPAMSAEETFNVIVVRSPGLLSATTASGQIQLRWSAIPGQRYQIQTTENLTANSWTNLGAEIIADEVTASFTEAIGTERQRFYRLILLE